MESLLSWILNGAGLSNDRWEELQRQNPKSLLPTTPNASQDLFGLGWVVDNANSTILTHGGSEFGARTYLIVIPETRTGLIVATNASGGLPPIRMIIEATIGKQYPLNAIQKSFQRWESFEW
jgi:CubicO group peptidase (beta-lactamase class C family)